MKGKEKNWEKVRNLRIEPEFYLLIGIEKEVKKIEKEEKTEEKNQREREKTSEKVLF